MAFAKKYHDDLASQVHTFQYRQITKPPTHVANYKTFVCF